jgi:hypothetical protein
MPKLIYSREERIEIRDKFIKYTQEQPGKASNIALRAGIVYSQYSRYLKGRVPCQKTIREMLSLLEKEDHSE